MTAHKFTVYSYVSPSPLLVTGNICTTCVKETEIGTQVFPLININDERIIEQHAHNTLSAQH